MRASSPDVAEGESTSAARASSSVLLSAKELDNPEVTILGGGPAGLMAAAHLAGYRHNVLVVSRRRSVNAAEGPAIISAKAEPLLAEIGAPREILGEPVEEAEFYNADFTKSVKPRLSGVLAYLTKRSRLAGGLRQAAEAKGARFFDGKEVTGLRLNETDLTVSTAEGTKWKSRLLIFAAGLQSPLAEKIGFRAELGESPLWTAVVFGEPPVPAKDKPKLSLVLGLDGGNGFGLILQGGAGVAVCACVGREPGRLVSILQQICTGAVQHGIFAADLAAKAAKAKVYRSPAGAALDLESHVAKHTLVIGNAGGFISAASNEGIYPAMWSGKLAAETIHSALKSRFSQDALMAFDSNWRMQMADYLRSPHSDVRFLLPLIFSNQPMADRMAAAFFFGENL